MANRQLFLFLLIFVCVLFNIDANSQSSLSYNWYVNANAGASHMFGDQYAETDYGFGIRAGHYFSPKIAGHLQISQLSFKGSKNKDDIGFNTSMTEMQLGWSANLTNLIFGNKERIFNVYGFTGLIGEIFKSEAYKLSTGEIVEQDGITIKGEHNNSTPEFAVAIPLGLGIDIKLAQKWYLNLESGLRLSNSDLLDGYISGGNGDAYYYSSLGISYNFKHKKAERIPEIQPSLIAEKPVNPYENQIVDLKYYFPRDLESLDTFEMKSRIYKGNINGRAELTQILPIGFNVIDTAIANARTEFKDYILNLYWDEIPADSIFDIKFTVQLDKIYGNLPMTSILYFASTGKQYRFLKDIYIKRKNVEKPIVIEDEIPTKVETNLPVDLLEFRVQLKASYKRKLSTDSLSRFLRIDKPIIEEFIDNWYKYTVGSFNTYNEANYYKNELILTNESVKDAFIIAYFNHKRLSNQTQLNKITLESLQQRNLAAKPIIKETNDCYRIQILSVLNRKADINLLKNKYNIEQTINEEVFYNFSKYTVGDCLTKQEALNLRLELINKGLEDSFLVSYTNGIRN